MPVSVSQTNLLELNPRIQTMESTEFLEETPVQSCSITTNFPLLPTSEDYLSSCKDDQTGSLSRTQQYLKVLKAASSSSWTADKELAQFDSTSPNIVNTLDQSQGAAPLHYASINGNVPLVTFLLENGADVDIWDASKKVTPLFCACFHGHIDVIQILMDYDCNLNAGLNNNTNIEQHSGLLWAVRGRHLKVVRFLLDNNVCQNSLIPFSETPIHAAVMASSPEILEMLVSAQDSRIKTDFQLGPEKNSPLHLATSGDYGNSFELCKILVENGNANVNSLNSRNKTPLHYAMRSQHVNTVKLLIFHSAKVNAVDNEGKTPLFYGIGDNREALDCMEALIEEGHCNVNYQDKCGNTPLHIAGMYESAAAVEILLLNRADFSLKAAGGISALSILRKKISATPVLLDKALDRAVTLTNFQECDEAKTRQDCKVVVDFRYVLSSAASTTKYATSSLASQQQEVTQNNSKAYARIERRISSIFKDVEDSSKMTTSTRNETAKIKCLVKDEYLNTLLHPVIQSFLELKWYKARPIFFPTLIFKGILAILFTLYLQTPYVFSRDLEEQHRSLTEVDSADQLTYLTHLYTGIITMAMMRGVLEVISILRAPKQRLKSFDLWISTAVLLSMIFYMDPETWQESYNKPLKRSMAALGIWLVWLDMWIDMARLPRIGLSIRVFLQVLKSFSSFVMPHFCLLAGFILSFTILFPKNAEYQSFAMGIGKIIRIMAGDVTIPPKGSDKTLTPEDDDDYILSQVIIVCMFTACVLTVSIVLMDLLIGLAVNDIKRIYDDASTDRLVKQTMLLNTLETSICGKWTRCCLPKGCFSRFVNLFPESLSDKTITFNPYDSRDLQISNEQRKDLLRIGSVNHAVKGSQKKKKSCPALPTSNNFNLLRKAVIVNRFKNVRSESQQHLLMENINRLKLVVSYLEDKLPRTSTVES